MGKATVIGRIDEDPGFIDRVNCLLVKQGDAVALADAIRWGYSHRGMLAEIGATSVAAVRLNFRPMILWAALIVVLVVLGMVPGLIGLIVALPLVAYATWHAYRDVVRFEGIEPD